MTEPSDRAAEAIAELIRAALGPPPPGAGHADRRTQRATARRHALAAARVSGCKCNPEITFHPVDPKRRSDMPSVTIAHDDWCPMLNHGSQLMAYNQPSPHPRR